jgi:hypothetical protein
VGGTPEDPRPVAFGVITVHPPDIALRSFWFSHDLAGVFGLEYNADAKKKLHALLRERGAKGFGMEHEADAVTVRTRSVETMIDVLRAVRDCAPDRFREVDDEPVATALRKAPFPKAPPRQREGDVVAVPVGREMYGAVQVIHCPHRLGGTYLVLDLAPASLDELTRRVQNGEGAGVAARAGLDPVLAASAAERGTRIAQRPLPADVDVPVLIARESSSSGDLHTLLCACIGARPWAGTYERYRLHGRPLPRARGRREIFEHRLREVFAEPPEPPEEGAASVRVIVPYEGGGKYAIPFEHRTAQRIGKELKLLQAPDTTEPATWSDADGFFDVFAHVADVRATREQLALVLAELRLTGDWLLEVYPRFTFDWNGTLARMVGESR